MYKIQKLGFVAFFDRNHYIKKNTRTNKSNYCYLQDHSSGSSFFHQKLNKITDFFHSKRVIVFNLHSGKFSVNKKLEIKKICYRKYKFTTDGKLLVIRTANKKYFIYSTDKNFELLKEVQVNFKTQLMFMGKEKMYLTHYGTKQVTFFDLKNVKDLVKKNDKELETHHKKMQAVELLRKRMSILDQRYMSTMEGYSMDVFEQVPEFEKFELPKKRGKLQKDEARINKLFDQMQVLEQSIKEKNSFSKIMTLMEEKIKVYKKVLRKK